MTVDTRTAFDTWTKAREIVAQTEAADTAEWGRERNVPTRKKKLLKRK